MFHKGTWVTGMLQEVRMLQNRIGYYWNIQLLLVCHLQPLEIMELAQLMLVLQTLALFTASPLFRIFCRLRFSLAYPLAPIIPEIKIRPFHVLDFRW